MFGKKKEKIFCIGRNKTGTTSLEKALTEFGYKMGNQSRAELLIKYYRNYNWNPIINFCKSADAFQDVPFSWPYTWLILHEKFPKSKFILTTRDEEEWYESITSFHSKKFSDGKTPPNKKDLQEATYRYKGFVWDANRAVWKTPEDDVYNKEIFLNNYRSHNISVLNYFKDNPNFLHLDLSNSGSYKTLASFLGKKPLRESFPHLNKTKEIEN